jgi:hypothetical protein
LSVTNLPVALALLVFGIVSERCFSYGTNAGQRKKLQINVRHVYEGWILYNTWHLDKAVKKAKQ